MTENYGHFAIDIARKAGDIIRRDFSLDVRKVWKADNTPLTETDLIINQLVIDSVKQKFPSHSILAEEGNDFSKESEYVWVCDPLDGTIPFSHGIPTCTFSLALVHKGESILGVIYDPFMDRMNSAEKGRGAFMNGSRISVSSNIEIKSSLIGLIQWSDAKFDLSQLEHQLQLKGAKVLNAGSISYMGALVSSGGFTATIFPGDKPHDTAALKVLVEEAGGKVTDIFGNEQRYDRPIKGHVTSNGILHEKLLALVRETIKK